MQESPATNEPTTRRQFLFPEWYFGKWRGLFRFSAAKLLGALLLFLVTVPFLDQLQNGQLIGTLLMTAVLITATLAMGNRRWTLIVATLLVIPSLLLRWAFHIFPGVIPPEIFSVTEMLFVAFVVFNILDFVLRADEVGAETICAGISGYLLMGFFWAFAYTLIAAITPGAFSFTIQSPAPQEMKAFTSLYFSYVTLSSVGYGDIVPVAPAARMLSMIEAMCGTFYVAVLIARLVALYSMRKRRD